MSVVEDAPATRSHAHAHSQVQADPALVAKALQSSTATPAALALPLTAGIAAQAGRQWNPEHARAMRGAEALLAIGVMAYFVSGLLGTLGVV